MTRHPNDRMIESSVWLDNNNIVKSAIYISGKYHYLSDDGLGSYTSKEIWVYLAYENDGSSNAMASEYP